MKRNILLILALSLAITSCLNGKSDKESLVKKRITQKIEADGMGMIKDVKIEAIKKVNDSTYNGIHTFKNPVFNKEVRITRDYIFTIDLDSIVRKKDIKSEMKSEGEWVKMDL